MPRKLQEIPWLTLRDGVYYVFWHDTKTGTTKRLSLRTGDRVEAQSTYAAFLSEGHAIFNPGEGLSVSRALDDYIREHVATKCVAVVRQTIGVRHLKAWFGGALLRDIDIPSCRAYLDHRVGQGLAPSTVRRELNILRAAAEHEARWKRIPANEMPTFELPVEPPAVATWLTREELERLINAAEGRLRDFVLVAYYTAGRRASVEKLTARQVDLKHSRIDLTHPDETPNQRRSKKRRPVVPIDPKVRPTIERLMIEADAAGSEYLFGADAWMYRRFVQLMAELGLEGSPHILRHSRATHLLQAGVSIYDVARLLGDTVATVERVYGHHSADLLAEAIRRAG